MYGYKHYIFSLSVDKDALLAVYKGAIKRIRVRTTEGMVLDIDADHLKQFTTQSGIYGRFDLTTTKENKFVEIKRLD